MSDDESADYAEIEDQATEAQTRERRWGCLGRFIGEWIGGALLLTAVTVVAQHRKDGRDRLKASR